MLPKLISKNLKNSFFISVLTYIILGLAGLFFFSRYLLPPGYVLGGHDSGLPLDSKEFLLTRFFAWDERIGFGRDNSHLFGSLPLHFFDYLSSIITGTPYAGNWFNLFFWLGLLFIASLIFAFQLKKYIGPYFVFLFPPIIIFNFYLFQSIFILERAKYGILVAGLLFLAILMKVQEKKLPVFIASFFSALIFFLFNGGSLLGVSLYGSVLVIVLGIFLFYFIYSVVQKDFSEFKRIVSYIFLTGVILVLLNAYQILPYLPAIFERSFFEHLGGTLSQSKDWVNYISQNTSILNFFRLQGVPMWFSDLYEISGEHPYAFQYLGDNFLTLISFIFPVLAFLSLVIFKEPKTRKVILLFAIITLISMLFAAGTHPPFGKIYGLIYDNFPGFFIFRTPYYKFSGSVFIGMAVLIAATCSFFTEKLAGSVKGINLKGLLPTTGLLVSFLFIGLWLNYHQALFKPENIFRWRESDSTRFVAPDYIEEARILLNKIDSAEGRVLVVPPSPDSVDSYTWGYWSLSSLFYSLTRAPVIINELGLNSEEKAWVNFVYKLLKEGDSRFVNSASSLGVGFILYRDDISLPESKKNEYRLALNSLEGLEKISSLGEWTLYKINNKVSPKISAATTVVGVPEGEDYLTREFIKERNNLYVMKGGMRADDNLYAQRIQVFQCISCLLEKKQLFSSLPAVTILPNSILYFFKDWEERQTLQNTKSTVDKINAYLGFILRRGSETMSMLALEINERDTVNNLKTLNIYLDQVYNLVTPDPNYLSDFQILRTILDYLNQVEHEFNNYIKSRDFHTKGTNFREEMLGVLWNIHKIKTAYSPYLDNIERWGTEKIYKVNFPEDGKYKLYFNLSSMPKDYSQQLILSKRINLIKVQKEQDIKFTSQEDKWLAADIGYQDKGEAKLVLEFPDMPNLFDIENSKIEYFPEKERYCLRGKVNNFQSVKRYVVKLIPKEGQTSTLGFVLRDPNKTYSKKHGFIQGEVEANFPGDQPFRYAFDPAPIQDLELLVCSEGKQLPKIKEAKVQEIFQPLVISVFENEERIVHTAPKVTYQRINSTRYLVNIRGASQPFLLTFNEGFSPFWKLNKNVGTHLMVDGYANGWVIDKQGDWDLTIEYIPQKLFYLGGAITILVTIFLGILAFYLKKRKL